MPLPQKGVSCGQKLSCRFQHFADKIRCGAPPTIDCRHKIGEERMKNKADYSLYKCPYSHLEKECGHELHGPEGYQDTYGVWCSCGFRGPVFYLDPIELKLEPKIS